jgi:hypothetical protein
MRILVEGTVEPVHVNDVDWPENVRPANPVSGKVRLRVEVARLTQEQDE